MNEVFGLPAHPLLVHVPVVLIPLSLVGAVAMAVRPGWRQSLSIPTALIACAGALGAILASGSGEWLQERVTESGLIRDHGELGEMARNLAILTAIALVTWAARELLVERGWLGDNVIGRLLSPKWVGTAAIVGSLLFGTLATVWVVRAGHTGAKAAWQDKPLKAPEAGEDGERD